MDEGQILASITGRREIKGRSTPHMDMSFYCREAVRVCVGTPQASGWSACVEYQGHRMRAGRSPYSNSPTMRKRSWRVA